MQHTGHNYYFDRKYQISWSTAKKVLPLYQQFPPRLFTMRTTRGHLISRTKDKCLNLINLR